MLDLNTASAEDLDAIPALAGHGFEIVRYREERRKFDSVSQLEEVPGLAGKWQRAEHSLTIGQADPVRGFSRHAALTLARVLMDLPGAASRAFCLLPAALAALASAHAAQADPPQSDQSPEGDIVVLGRGLELPPGAPAYGTVVLDRAQLTRDASGRVEDALADVAGLQEFRRSDSRSANPSAQGVTLRSLGGNAASRALVLLDGVPIADPFFGSIPFNTLSPDRLSAVRINRGGGAGPFGSGALTGTVELVSADRAELPPIGVSAVYGSNDAVELTGSVSPTLGSGYASLSGRFERGEGFFTTPVDQRVPATVRAAYRDWSVNLRTIAPIDALTELQFRGTLFGDDRTLRFRGANSRSEGEDASIRLIRRGHWQIDALAYVQARNFANKVISATSFKLTLDQRSTPSTGIGGKIELRPPVGNQHVLRIGVDLRRSQGELYEYAYAPTGVISARRNAGGEEVTGGVFVEDDWSLGKLTLTGGARLDRWTITGGFFREHDGAGFGVADTRFPDRAGTEATARGGALIKVDRAIALRAAAYTGYRLPTLNELYRPFVVFPVTTDANPDLSPEQLRGVEAGIELAPTTWSKLAITAFYNRLGSAIANVAVGTNLRERQNVRAIVANGVELTASAKRGAFSFEASYASSDAQVRAPGLALDGFAPAQSPRHSASVTAAYGRGDTPSLSATLRYVGKQFEDDLETDVLPPATTVDLDGQWPVGRSVVLVARAENLFDAAVYTRNQAGSIDLGQPRTLWIGVSLGR